LPSHGSPFVVDRKWLAERWCFSRCFVGRGIMLQAHSFYELTWWSVRERIGWGLREHYEVPKELPPELLTLITKLDDSDWLFPSAAWHNDADLLFG
jgi:hypothetical protein